MYKGLHGKTGTWIKSNGASTRSETQILFMQAFCICELTSDADQENINYLCFSSTQISDTEWTKCELKLATALS